MGILLETIINVPEQTRGTVFGKKKVYILAKKKVYSIRNGNE